MKKSQSPQKGHSNNRVAQKRGKKWRENLVRGKMEAATKPSILRQARIKKGVSQELVCKKAKITSLSTYGAIERAKRYVTAQKANDIAKALRKSRKTLFEKTESAGKVKYLARK